jgi:uncharacterized repeat protein (TIGR01451 family)
MWSNNLAGSGNTGGCAMTRNATSTGIASLSAVQTASKAVAGQPLTYTLTVTNKSYQDAAAALTATETLPAGMTYSQTASGPAPLSVSADRRTVTWRVGVLNPNVCGALYNYWTCLWEEAALPVHSTQVITYQVNTDPNTAIGTTVTNCATMHWSSWAIKPTDLGNSQDKYDFGVPMNINPRSTPACATAKFQPPTVSKGPGGPPAV